MTVSQFVAGSNASHLIIPYAASQSPALREALPGLDLPHLKALLKDLVWVHSEPAEAQPLSLDMPHERTLAKALLMPSPAGEPGAWPWAALGNQASNNVPQAFFTPCHWQIGMDQVIMLNPAELNLSESESQALLEAMNPFFQEDGLTVRYLTPTQWHVQGEMLRDLQCASLERVVGMNVNLWLPKSDSAKALRRLQSEMQMLLYNHPVNDARLAQRQWTVNSFWVHGAGVLAEQPQTAPPQVTYVLREPALREDAAAWTKAWLEVDATLCAELRRQMSTRPVTLTLCSEQTASTYQNQSSSTLHQLWHRAKGLVQPQSVSKTLLAL